MLENMCKLDTAVHNFGHRKTLQMPAEKAGVLLVVTLTGLHHHLMTAGAAGNEGCLIACTALTRVPERCKLGNSSMVSKKGPR